MERRYPPRQRLSSYQGLGMFEPCGQSEPLTTRLSNLLEDYGDGFAVLKELIQNAEDAGASKIFFMYDERQNEDLRSKVIGNMAECQGPALWVYNDETFKEKDFRNITKLGGRTKESDRQTIGKFGLGFCSVYNLTDVPSILSGDSMLILDPHQSYLGGAIEDKGNPGIKIKLQNDEVFKTYAHQFEVFQDVFHCNLKSKPRYYRNTLFRLPLRTKEQAARSDIKKLHYNNQEMLQLLQKLEKSLADILIFTQNLKQIELWHLGRYERNPKKLVFVFGAQKDAIRTLPLEMEGRSIIKAAVENLVDFQQNGAKQLDILQEFTIRVFLKKTLLTMNRNEKTYDIRWMVSWSTGKNYSREMALKMTQKGALSLGSVAVSLNDGIPRPFPLEEQKFGFCTKSLLFCLLPLPQETSLPVHVNGCFAVTNDRKQIRSTTYDDKSMSDSSWNDALISDAICEAYVNLLVQLNQIEEKTGIDYSLLWPKDEPTTSIAKNPVSLILESFYTNVVLQNPCVFCNSRNTRASFSDCVFLDRELSYDKRVGKAAFNCLLNFCDQNGEKNTVMEMSEVVLNTFIKVGLQDDLQKKTICTYAFYQKIFLPNIQSVTNKNERNTLVLFAINHQDEELKNLLKYYACIPTLPRNTLRKPEDLVRPNSEISGLFYKTDERFVSGTKATFLSESVLDVLTNLGMMHNRMPKEIVIDRAMSVSNLVTREEQVRRCKRLLAYLQKEDDFIAELSSVDFLPVCRRPDNWPLKWQNDGDTNLTRCNLKAPEDLFLERTKGLVGCTRYVVDNKNIGSDNVSELLLTLGCSDERHVVTDDVVQQLEAVSNIGTATISREALEELTCITDLIYAFFEKKLARNEKIHLRHFCDKPVLLLKERLICPRRATTGSLHGLDCEPILYNVTKKYRRLFKAVGVRDVLMTEDVVNVICDLQSSYVQHMERLNDEQIKLHSNLLQLMVKVSKDSNDYIQTKDVDRIMVPDVESVLRHAKDLCTDDGYTKLTRHEFLHFVNENIPVSVHKCLNIKSKRQQHLTSISCAMPFGQKEELVTRIRGILDNYPMSHSILNELLQNADDAGAFEIDFILDKRDHSKVDIFSEHWRDLQGPALCVFNNACFNEKDLKGIASLGKGSKSNDPTKTGQFGIGFNAVYHITDAPSFISIGKATPNGGTFCALDPHCKYSPTATVEQPGMLIPDLRDLQNSFPGVYNCYLQTELQKREGTWFRFPLRSPSMARESRLSNKATTPEDIETMFHNFREQLPKSLLFLKNVRTVNLSVIGGNGNIKKTYSVSAKISKSDNIYLDKFLRYCYLCTSAIKNGNKLLTDVPMEQVSYNIGITDSHGEFKDWIITQGFGTSSRNRITNDLIKWVKNGEIGLSPKGGVAVNISDVATNENIGYVFCSLPLPILTGLPLHINGHFALDPSRQYIKEDDKVRSPSGEWNKFILGNVIPAAYVRTLEIVRDCFFPKIPRRKFRYTEFRKEAIKAYHGFFPLYSTIISNVWKDTVTQVYKIIVDTELELFPVLRREEVWWVALKTTGQAFLSYFDDLEIDFNQEITAKRYSRQYRGMHINNHGESIEDMEKSKKEAKTLSLILRDIGMKIVDTPLIVFENLTKEDTNDGIEFIQLFRKVSARAILQFLISVQSETVPDGCSIHGFGCRVENSTLRSLDSVKLIIEFCLRREPDLFLDSLSYLPLLLTNEMRLYRFKQVSPLYFSPFCNLLPNSSRNFVAEGLVNTLKTIQINDRSILKDLGLDVFCKLLPQNFNEDQLKSNEPILWTEFPTFTWIKHFFSFLDSLVLDKSKLQKILSIHLGNWCLVPAEYKIGNLTKYVLVPMNTSYGILDVHTFQKNYLKAFSSLEAPIKCDHIHSRTLSHIMASADMPESILKFLYHHRDILWNADHTTKDTILRWLNKNLDDSSSEKSSSKKMLRSLSLYRTIAGNYENLERTAQEVLILKKNGEQDMPLDGITEWATKSQYILLYHNPRHERLEVQIGAILIDVENFYKEHLLPCFCSMDKGFYLKHLNYVKDNFYLQEFASVLQRVQFISTRKGIKTADFFFNHRITLFSLMISKDRLPPKPFSETNWEAFMICAGMKNEVTVDMLVAFALHIEREGALGISEDLRRISEEILNHFIRRKNLVNGNILHRIKDIRFIVPHEVLSHLVKIYPQYNENTLISFSGSTSHNCQRLVWSTMSILPDCVDDVLKHSNGKHLHVIQKQLGIHVIPPVIVLVSHVHNICTSLQKDFNRSKLAKTQIQELMDEFYLHLQKYGKCEEAKTAFSQTPLVLIPEKQCLVKPDQMVENILQENEIPPFLMKFPLIYGRYKELFKYYGATENVTLAQYAETLKCFYDISMDGYLPPEEQENAGKAINGLLDLLSKKTEKDIENELKDIDSLYLLNDDKSARRCTKSTEMIVPDNKSHRDRLKNISSPYLYKYQDDKIYKKLPQKLQPLYLTEIVDERLFSENNESIHDELTIMMQQLLHSSNFNRGVNEIIRVMETSSTSRSVSDVSYRMKKIHICCLDDIVTILRKEGEEIIESKQSVKCFIQEHTSTIFVKKDDSGARSFLKTVKNPISNFICKIFEIPVEIGRLKINEMLDFIGDLGDLKSHVREMINKEEEENENDWSPELGSFVPIALHCLLDNTFRELEVNEIVAYEIWDSMIDDEKDDNSDDQIFLYAKVHSKHVASNIFDQKYCINIGVKGCEDVPCLKLYRFFRKPTENCSELVIFTDESKYANRLEKDATFQQIRQALIEAWRKDESIKKTVLKRLLLKWHPDKNPNCKEFSIKVTQFIFDIIRRLENGETLDETNLTGNRQRQYPPFTESFSQWNTFRTFMRQRGSKSSYGRYCPSDSNPQPGEAKRWMKQANLDLLAARATFSTAKDTKSFNWVCFQCHQACEKAWKAFGINQDIRNVNKKTHILMNINSKVSPEVSGSIVPLLREMEKLASSYSGMRYPDACPHHTVPGEFYEEHHALKALEVANSILTKISDNLQRRTSPI